MNREERESFNKMSPSVGGLMIKEGDGESHFADSIVEGVTGDNQTIYRKADGTWTTDPLSSANFSLDEDTGTIKLTAPKSIYELPEFENIFNSDTIKSYSAAYRSNPSYRIPYTQRNEDGTTTETQITIPEFVEKLNDALGNFVENYRVAEKNRKKLIEKYGDKANNLTLSQLSIIQSSGADANRIYLPDFIFDFDSDFLSLANKRDEDGSVSVEDFMKVYNRSKVDQSDLAEIMAAIEGHVNNSEWGEDTVTYDSGETVKNANSASEAAKALSLKNFILSKDPDAEWYQSLSDGLVTFVSNAAKGFTNVFMNTATFAEGVVTFGQSHVIEGVTEEMNEAFSRLNEERSLIQDSTATLATLGQIGGMIGGTVLEGYLAGAAIKGVGAKYASKLAEGRAASEALLNIGPSARAALTAESMSSIVNSIKDISLGAKFAIRVSSVAQKLSWAKNIYNTYKGLETTHKTAYEALNWTTSFLLDTVHDAIVYDAVTLRHVIEGSDDQNMKDYWLGQLADNAKWWVGTGFAKTMFKYAGQTSIGQAIEAKVTTKLAGLSASIGDKKLAIKDSLYGGNYIRQIEDKIQNSKPGAARDRLIKQRNQELQNIMLRDARRQLAKMDLEFEGLKLTEESAENYRAAMTEIKNIELVIDRYGQDLGFKRQEMLGIVTDPSNPRRKIFVNPDLGGANVVSGRIYDKLAELTKKYGLRDLDSLGISQDIVDYVVGSYDLNIKKAIAGAGGDDAVKASADVETISANITALKNKLPEELISELDNSGAIKAYTDFYFALNDYAKAKGVVDIDTITSYQNNPIWSENGYMPVWKADERSGRWVSNDGTYQALIQRDIEHFEYNTKPGQHYVNPELTRQYRINDVAKEEVNQELKNAFIRLEDATNNIIVTGEESERVKNFRLYKKNLEQAINTASGGISDSLLIQPQKIDKKAIDSTKTFDLATRSEAISALSLDETRKLLYDKHILRGGNKYLSNLVTAENFDDWYAAQSQPVKNYINTELTEKYGYDLGVYAGEVSDATTGKTISDIQGKVVENNIPKNTNDVRIIKSADEADGLEYFDVLPSTEEQRGLLDFSKENAVPGYESLADYYHKEKNLAADIVFMAPDEYLNALLEKNGVAKGYKSIDDILKRSREHIDAPTGYGDYGKYRPGRGYKDYAEMMEGHDFFGYGENGSERGVKFHPPSIEYGENGYSGQDGVHRALAAREVGVKEMPVIVVHPYKNSPKAVNNLLQGKRHVGEVAKTSANITDDYSKKILLDRLNGRNIDVKQSSKSSEILVDFYPNAKPTYEMFEKAVKEGGDDFEAGLQRAYLAGNENFSKSPELNRIIENLDAGKSAFFEGYSVERAKARLQKIKGIDTDDLVDDLRININIAVNNYVATVLDNPGAVKVMGAIAGDGNNGAILAGKYTALQNLIKDKKTKDVFLKQVRKSLLHKGISMDNAEKIVTQAEKLWTDYIRSELDDAMNALRTTNKELVNSQNIYEEVNNLSKKIDSAKEATKKGGNAIMYLDDKGRQVFAEVDPNYASLYNLRYEMSDVEASAFAKVNAAMSKLFRYGTTTLNLSSFSNQLFRDTGNALIVGGAWETIKKNANNLVEVFGDDIVEQIKRFDPSGYEMRQAEALAKETGQTLQEAAVSRELAKGAAVSPATTETTLYKDVLRKARGKSSSIDIVDSANEKLQSVTDIFNKVDGLMNGKREIYLRNRVYANNLSRALKQGYTLEQARTYANFAMNNATTNFTRQLYHMQAIADSTPYFKAAINGTKSFWRMWSLDPVGISGRMMGGLILPTIFLTGASLGDPDNREVYKNLPEYQKNENLIFVVDKQVISIPIPQEMANIVSPFRQFTEYLYNSNQNDFWELMMNDVLGFSPVDLEGFSTIDMDRLSHDPTIGDRISRGFSRVFSQIAPVPVKSAYMLVTGTDPYTGKNLYDPSYTYWDDATNSVQTMDYNQNLFAKWVAKMWGNDSNAAVLEKVISGIFGSTGSNLLGEVVALVEKGPGDAAETLAKDAITQATNPYTVQTYDQIDSIWKRAVRELTAEKDAITNSKEFKTIYSELSQTKDEEKRKKLMASGQDIIKDYQNKVVEIAKRLESVYQGTFDRKKFGAVMQLLNFNTDPIYQSGTQYSSNIASDAYYEGRDAAIATMQALGVTGSKDMSIFGYLTTDENGNSVMKYSSPVAIMDMKNTWMGAKDIDQANIEAKLKTDGIKTSDMWDGFYVAKAKGAAALKQYKSEWNAKVVKSLAPYISERGIESVLKNNKTIELIDDYLLIDNKYQTKAYLKKIFENE